MSDMTGLFVRKQNNNWNCHYRWLIPHILSNQNQRMSKGHSSADWRPSYMGTDSIHQHLIIHTIHKKLLEQLFLQTLWHRQSNQPNNCMVTPAWSTSNLVCGVTFSRISSSVPDSFVPRSTWNRTPSHTDRVCYYPAERHFLEQTEHPAHVPLLWSNGMCLERWVWAIETYHLWVRTTLPVLEKIKIDVK